LHRKTLPKYTIASGHENISVETVLNSRCNSDWTGNPYEFHWGMFDAKKNLSGDLIEKIITLSQVPSLTDLKIRISRDSNTLSFLVPNTKDSKKMSWLMVESGMQQQAVCLCCALLGVGMVFNNRGRDGQPISDKEFETTKIVLGPMKPGYDGSYWTSKFPGDPSPWMPGDLSDPKRDGGIPYLSGLNRLELSKIATETASKDSLSQLLWAARGRTPHFYLARPWGLTIPTRTGQQDITSLYVINNDKSYSYVNWLENRPTQSLQPLSEFSEKHFSDLSNELKYSRELIVIGINEDRNWALWEVGYQLFNLQIQACSLGISFKTFLLDDKQREIISAAGINNPVVAFSYS